MTDLIAALYEVEWAARKLVEGSTSEAIALTIALIDALDALDAARDAVEYDIDDGGVLETHDDVEHDIGGEG